MTRPVKTATCKCGAKILTGLDADTCGLLIHLDAKPVDQLGEFLAVATGRLTYDLRPVGTRNGIRHEMQQRGPAAIKTGARHRVHAEHRCGQPLPAAVTSTPSHTTEVPYVAVEGAPF